MSSDIPTFCGVIYLKSTGQVIESKQHYVSGEWLWVASISVDEATLLSLGFDPAELSDDFDHPKEFFIRRKSIISAIEGGKAMGKLVACNGSDKPTSGEKEEISHYDTQRSTVDADSLSDWFIASGRNDFFFSRRHNKGPAYLDKSHPHYSWRLAGAIKAWLAFANTDVPRNHVKRELSSWIDEHSAEYMKESDPGQPSATTTEDMATLANWNFKGGREKD